MNTQTRINVSRMSGPATQGQQAQQGQSTQHGIDLLAGEAEIVAAAPAANASTPLHPVVVVAGKGRLQAQIARFDIRRTGSEVCVTCVSGSLAFEHPQGRLTLLAQQQLVYDDRYVHPVSQVNPANVTAWRQGVLVFDGIPLAQVVDEINRYRPGKLILHNASLGESQVQARFPIAKLDDVIDMFGKLYGARVTKLPGNIVLLS
jgi:transmembrane sensor